MHLQTRLTVVKNEVMLCNVTEHHSFFGLLSAIHAHYTFKPCFFPKRENVSLIFCQYLYTLDINQRTCFQNESLTSVHMLVIMSILAYSHSHLICCLSSF